MATQENRSALDQHWEASAAGKLCSILAGVFPIHRDLRGEQPFFGPGSGPDVG